MKTKDVFKAMEISIPEICQILTGAFVLSIFLGLTEIDQNAISEMFVNDGIDMGIMEYNLLTLQSALFVWTWIVFPILLAIHFAMKWESAQKVVLENFLNEQRKESLSNPDKGQ